MAKVNQEILKIIKKRFDDGILILNNDGKIYKKLQSGKIVEYGSKHERGYIYFGISIDGVEYRTFAHRIIYYLHHGVWDDNKIINHLDGKKDNNRIENLELVTQFENILYSLRKDEIIFEASMIDEATKAKYRLDGEKWEIFKKEAYEGCRRFVFKNHAPDSMFYQLCKDFDTLEGYKENIGVYFDRAEKKAKKNNKH